MRSTCTCALAVLCLLSITPYSQITEATLKLNVFDSQSSAVAGSIEVINEETNLRRLVTADSSGQATITALRVEGPAVFPAYTDLIRN